MQELENAKREIKDLQKTSSSTLRIGISSLPIWIEALESFQIQYPNIKIDYFFLPPFQLTGTNKNDEIDFFLGVQRDIPCDRFEIVHARCTERPVVILSHLHHLANADSISLSQCRDDTFLSLGKTNPSAHKYILDMCSAAGFSPRKIIECDYFFRMKMLLDNRGIALTTELGAQSIYSDPAKVRVIPVNDPIITRTQCIAWKKNKYLTKDAIIFRNYFATYYFHKPEQNIPDNY